MHWPEEDVAFPQGRDGNNVSIDSSSRPKRRLGLEGRRKGFVGKVGWGRGELGSRHICFSGCNQGFPKQEVPPAQTHAGRLRDRNLCFSICLLKPMCAMWLRFLRTKQRPLVLWDVVVGDVSWAFAGSYLLYGYIDHRET